MSTLRCSVMQQSLQCVFVQISSMVFISDITRKEKRLLLQSGNRIQYELLLFLSFYSKQKCKKTVVMTKKMMMKCLVL